MQKTMIRTLMMFTANATAPGRSLRPGEDPIHPTAPKPILRLGDWRMLDLNNATVQDYLECMCGVKDQRHQKMGWFTDDQFIHFIDYETKLTTAGYGPYWLPVLSDARDAWVGMTLKPSEDKSHKPLEHGAAVRYTGDKEEYKGVTYHFQGMFTQEPGRKAGVKTYADHFPEHEKFALVSRWFKSPMTEEFTSSKPDDSDEIQDANFVVLPFDHIIELKQEEIQKVHNAKEVFLDKEWDAVHNPDSTKKKLPRPQPTRKTEDFTFLDGTKMSDFTKLRKELDAQEERDDKKRLKHFQKYPDLANYLESWIPIPSKWTVLRYSAMAIAAIFMTIWIIRLPFRIIGL